MRKEEEEDRKLLGKRGWNKSLYDELELAHGESLWWGIWGFKMEIHLHIQISLYLID